MPTNKPLKIKDASIGKLNCLYLAETEKKGLGVFTSKNIRKGTVLEVAPVIVMQLDNKKHLDKTLLHDYIFMWGPNEERVAMALGCIPMYNHSYTSNCEYEMNFATNEMMIHSIRSIKAGEEITINYNGSWNNDAKVWFDTVAE